MVSVVGSGQFLLAFPGTSLAAPHFVIEAVTISRSPAMVETNVGNSPEERANIELVREYMTIAYDPERAGAEAVAHLCAPGNRFVAPSTFPGIHTLEQYAEDHGKLMKQVDDLHFVGFDVLFASGDRVALRYTAEGSHGGEPHGDIPPTGRTARWTAGAFFRVEGGKLVEFIKDWNKLSMWEQLGWPVEECLTQESKG